MQNANETHCDTSHQALSHRLPGKNGQHGLVLVGARGEVDGASRLFQFFAKKPPVLPRDFVVIRTSLGEDITQSRQVHSGVQETPDKIAHLHSASKVIIGPRKILQLLRKKHGEIPQTVCVRRSSFNRAQINGFG